jgi:hypothetical protein
VNDILQPTWDEVDQLLLQLPVRPGTQVSLDAGDDTWLVIEYVGDLGYFVCGGLARERDYFNLIDRGLGDAIVEGDLAHERHVFPRHALVGRDTMLRAAKTFYESGQWDPGCEWVPERDAFYD